MTVEIITDGTTEADLEARANGALRKALPCLNVSGIKRQLTFSFKLGHKRVVVDGRSASSKQGQLDILIERESEKLAVLELQRPGQPLSRDDVEQGLSYARVLHPRPPIVIVSNGIETDVYATH